MALRRARGLGGDPVGEIVLQLARGEPAAAAGGDPDQVADPRAVGCEEAVEHRRDQYGPAVVRFADLVEQRGVRIVQRRAQRLALAGREAELPGELDQRGRFAQIAAAAADRLGDQLGKGKMLEQRDDIRKALVESRHVDIGGFEEVVPQPVDDRVSHFMRDDVVAQAGEDGLARNVGAGIFEIRVEIAEQDGVKLAVVKGVAAPEGVRQQPQLRALWAGPQRYPAPERPVEIGQRPRREA